VTTISRHGSEAMQPPIPPGAPAPHPAGSPATTVEPIIDLQDVVKDYVTGAGAFRALDGVTLRVGPGELVAIQGRSGCGKSTLLNMITGIDRPTSGTITVAGMDLRRASENALARWRGRHVGVVFQFFQLIPTLTVAENVLLPMDFAGLGSPRERRARAAELLELVEMTDQADKLPLATSGGQQQRIAIARALANDPPVVVADEPTGNLDSATAAGVIALFQRLADAGRTVVLVTHDAELARQARRVVRMADGLILSSDTIVDETGDKRVRADG
jgi:putative ABC transport system ATP-binding protein